MAFFTLTFMGAGPLGALLSGYLVESLGPRLALITPAGLMLLVILAVIARSPLWAYRRGAAPTGPCGAAPLARRLGRGEEKALGS